MDRIPKAGEYISLFSQVGKVLEVYGTVDRYALRIYMVKNAYQRQYAEIHVNSEDTPLSGIEFATAQDAAKEIAKMMAQLKDRLNENFPEAMEILRNG